MEQNSIDQARELLRRSSKILERFLFSEDGEKNNDDVIDLQKEIDKFLNSKGD